MIGFLFNYCLLKKVKRKVLTDPHWATLFRSGPNVLICGPTPAVKARGPTIAFLTFLKSKTTKLFGDQSL